MTGLLRRIWFDISLYEILLREQGFQDNNKQHHVKNCWNVAWMNKAYAVVTIVA